MIYESNSLHAYQGKWGINYYEEIRKKKVSTTSKGKTKGQKINDDPFF